MNDEITAEEFACLDAGEILKEIEGLAEEENHEFEKEDVYVWAESYGEASSLLDELMAAGNISVLKLWDRDLKEQDDEMFQMLNTMRLTNGCEIVVVIGREVYSVDEAWEELRAGINEEIKVGV